MSLQITHQADYAMRALMYIAQAGPDRQVPSHEIAEKMVISPMFLSRINSQLSNAGLVNTRRGAHGGIMLSRPPSQINIYEILTAIDGPIAMTNCSRNPGSCTLSKDCPLSSVWQEAEAQLIAHLKKTTLQDLVDHKSVSTL